MKIVTDNVQYAQVILKVGTRNKISGEDFSDILAEEVEAEMKSTAEISMGTEISDSDVLNIKALAEQVLSMGEYRAQLFDYLKNRMMAIAPNLTIMVGELVGARLIAHAGSLMNLAKAPASTVQILELKRHCLGPSRPSTIHPSTASSTTHLSSASLRQRIKARLVGCSLPRQRSPFAWTLSVTRLSL